MSRHRAVKKPVALVMVVGGIFLAGFAVLALAMNRSDHGGGAGPALVVHTTPYWPRGHRTEPSGATSTAVGSFSFQLLTAEGL